MCLWGKAGLSGLHDSLHIIHTWQGSLTLLYSQPHPNNLPLQKSFMCHAYHFPHIQQSCYLQSQRKNGIEQIYPLSASTHTVTEVLLCMSIFSCCHLQQDPHQPWPSWGVFDSSFKPGGGHWITLGNTACLCSYKSKGEINNWHSQVNGDALKAKWNSASPDSWPVCARRGTRNMFPRWNAEALGALLGHEPKHKY